MRSIVPLINSIPRLAAAIGREICSALRRPIMTQRNDGEKTWRDSRSTRTTRCSRGSIRRSLLAATVPPIPPPSTRTVFPCVMCRASEHDHFVGPLRPGGELSQRALVGSFDQFGFGDSTRIDTGTAHADLAAIAQHATQHHLDVVEALRHLLPGFRADRGISDQEYLHFLALRLR